MNSLLIGLVAWWIAEGSGIMQDIKWWLCEKKFWYRLDQFNIPQQRRLKPFDCVVCLGFWLGLFYNLNEGLYAPVYGIVASSVGLFISKIYK